MEGHRASRLDGARREWADAEAGRHAGCGRAELAVHHARAEPVIFLGESTWPGRIFKVALDGTVLPRHRQVGAQPEAVLGSARHGLPLGERDLHHPNLELARAEAAVAPSRWVTIDRHDPVAGRTPARTHDGTFTEEDAHPNPFEQFRAWLGDAHAAGITQPNAMTLATIDEHGHPDARIVLLKGLDGIAASSSTRIAPAARGGSWPRIRTRR